MKKLYLIRRTVETYLGPMTLAEMVVSYKRLEFGLQDEVAGSCGPWIQLDDAENVKRHYPEVAKVVSQNMIGGWAMSNHSNISTLKPAKNRHKKPIKRPHPKSHNRAWSVIFSVLLVASGALISYALVRSGRIDARWLGSAVGSNPVVRLQDALENGDDKAFIAGMREQIPQIVPRLTKSRKTYSEWIPLLRGYAFETDGSVDGLSTTLLRGIDASYAAPADCSLSAWKQYWHDGESQVALLLAGKKVSAQPWSQILHWDPLWILRRQKNSGWIKPQSYYEGCLWMATRSLREEGTLSKTEFTSELIERLTVIMARLAHGKIDTGNPKSLSFAYLSCLDKSITKAALANCVLPTGIDPEYSAYLQRARQRTEFSLILRNQSILNESETAELTTLSDAWNERDPMNGFSYSAEINFARALKQVNGDIKAASRRIQDEFPDVEFND